MLHTNRMRLLTFFAVAALACLACAVQANAGIEAASAAVPDDVNRSTPNGAAVQPDAAITHLNTESAP